MSPVALVIASVLAIIAVMVLFGLLYLIIMPARRVIVAQKDRSRVRYALQYLATADELIERKEFPSALRVLKQSIIFDNISDEDLLETYRDHHENVLSRMIVIAEELGSRPDHLAEVERLFMERADLMELFSRARESFKSLSDRRAKEGKSIPTWSKTDFEVRIVQIQEELKANLKALQGELEQLFHAVSNPAGQPIVYH